MSERQLSEAIRNGQKEFVVTDRRHEGLDVVQPYRPPQVIHVRDMTGGQDGAPVSYRHYEVPTEVLIAEHLAAAGHTEANRAAVDRMAAPGRLAHARMAEDDQALLSELRTALPASLWEALTAHQEARDEAQAQMHAASAALDTHQHTRPTRPEDVKLWGSELSRLQQEYSAYAEFAAQARATYEATAQRLLAALQDALRERGVRSEVQVEHARREAESLRAAADATERGAIRRQTAISRMEAKARKQGIAFFEVTA